MNRSAKPVNFPEVTTSDMAEALYMLNKGCSLKNVSLVKGPHVKNRFLMTFTGMNIRVWEMEYWSGNNGQDLSRLPCLFKEIEKHIQKGGRI